MSYPKMVLVYMVRTGHTHLQFERRIGKSSGYWCLILPCVLSISLLYFVLSHTNGHLSCYTDIITSDIIILLSWIIFHGPSHILQYKLLNITQDLCELAPVHTQTLPTSIPVRMVDSPVKGYWMTCPLLILLLHMSVPSDLRSSSDNISLQHFILLTFIRDHLIQLFNEEKRFQGRKKKSTDNYRILTTFMKSWEHN